MTEHIQSPEPVGWCYIAVANTAGLLARSRRWVRNGHADWARVWADLSTAGVMTLASMGVAAYWHLNDVVLAAIISVSISIGFEPFRDVVLMLLRQAPDWITGKRDDQPKPPQE